MNIKVDVMWGGVEGAEEGGGGGGGGWEGATSTMGIKMQVKESS